MELLSEVPAIKAEAQGAGSETGKAVESKKVAPKKAASKKAAPKKASAKRSETKAEA